jgi:hypothetical protein
MKLSLNQPPQPIVFVISLITSLSLLLTGLSTAKLTTDFKLAPVAQAQTSGQPATMKFSPASGTADSSSGLDVTIEVNPNAFDEEEVQMRSAAAIVTYDSSKVTVTGTEGDLFPDIQIDTSADGEIAVTGTRFSGFVSSAGTLATLHLEPVASSGTIELNFQCGSGESTNISDTNNASLLDCDSSATNTGSYTIGSGGDDPEPTDPPEDNNDDSSDDTSDDSSNDSSSGYYQTSGSQPAEPDTLPQSGPEDWLKWITSGLALIGVGLLLL